MLSSGEHYLFGRSCLSFFGRWVSLQSEISDTGNGGILHRLKFERDSDALPLLFGLNSFQRGKLGCGVTWEVPKRGFSEKQSKLHKFGQYIRLVDCEQLHAYFWGGPGDHLQHIVPGSAVFDSVQVGVQDLSVHKTEPV